MVGIILGLLLATDGFVGEHGPLPPEVRALAEKHSWREGCPLRLEELAYVRISHWDYEGKPAVGELVVDAALAAEIVEIFRELHAARFPIQKMRLIDHYQGSDDASMDDNNTSAFNCRWMTGKKGVFSNHSWGRAIDVNPLTNPYVTKKGSVSPKGGKPFADRQQAATGLIKKDDACYAAFAKRGWSWGGEWTNVKDYQHFEKPVASQKAVHP